MEIVIILSAFYLIYIRNSGIHFPGGWVDPTAGLDGFPEDIISYYALDWFRTAASRYTDYRIPADNELF
jgi:hypothetical protein